MKPYFAPPFTRSHRAALKGIHSRVIVFQPCNEDMLAPTCIVRTTSRVGPRQGPPVTADYLPAVPLAGSYKVMGELREIISEIAPDSSNPLLLEEYGAQLLDQIEHMARASQDAAAPARPSTS